MKCPPRNAYNALLALDMERNELTFYEYDYTKRRSSLTTLGLGSERQGDSIVVQGVDAQFTTLLRVGSGWVAWDAAREPFFFFFFHSQMARQGKNTHAAELARHRWAKVPKSERRQTRATFHDSGGRPRKYPKCPRYGSHRFSPTTGRCPCGFHRPEFPDISKSSFHSIFFRQSESASLR